MRRFKRKVRERRRRKILKFNTERQPTEAPKMTEENIYLIRKNFRADLFREYTLSRFLKSWANSGQSQTEFKKVEPNPDVY